MLAASPTHGPGTLKYGASRNGQSVPTHSPYHSSSRFPSTPIPRSSKAAADSATLLPSTSPTLRSNYQNASTQYSPMASISQESAIIKRSEDEETRVEIKEPTSSIALPTIPSQPTSPPPQTATSRDHSPTVKRRQLKDSVDIQNSSTKPRSSASKRPKRSKTTAKVLPNKYELCDVEDIVILIADMISELIETNDNLPLNNVVLTRFHSRTPPGISVLDYLQRLAKHATLTPPLLLSMVYYIDRLCSLYPAFTITTLTVHRFLITAATVAAKGLSDSFWNNSLYARVGGIKLAELGLLELEFLYRVDWKIVPNPEVLVDYYRGLVGRTEDYILESDVESSKFTSQEVTDKAEGLSRKIEGENGNRNEETGTEEENPKSNDTAENKWEEWMKDVADSSKGKGTSQSLP